MPIEITKEWESHFQLLCSSFHGSSRIIAIVGPKGSGKSTFALELFERLKKKKESVCFFDTDLGRPEFTVPGIISIHNSDSKLVKAIYLGEDDPSMRPYEYIKAIEACSNSIGDEFKFIIVNTHGWVSGLGQDVLEGILQKCKVTDVVQIIPEQKVSLGSLLRPRDDISIISIQPATEARNRESKVSKEQRFVDYFTSGKMFAVGFGQINICYPLDVIDRELPSQYAALALNASVVGLLKGSYKNPDSFLGVGLICSVDYEKRCYFVLCNLSLEHIKVCDTFVLGTTARVPLRLFSSKFHPQSTRSSSASKQAVIDFDEDDSEEEFIPYITNSKVLGFGSFQRKTALKRRRLADD